MSICTTLLTTPCVENANPTLPPPRRPRGSERLRTSHGGWQSWHSVQAAVTFSTRAIPFVVKVINARYHSLAGT